MALTARHMFIILFDRGYHTQPLYRFRFIKPFDYDFT